MPGIVAGQPIIEQPIVEVPAVVEQPVEVVTTPEVIDYGYGYGDYYGHGGHGGFLSTVITFGI
jgi:hypothetical protein